MKNYKQIMPTTILILTTTISQAKETVQTGNIPFDPEMNKIIPDKFFELGIPLLMIFILLNTIVSVLKDRADHQLKLKMVEKGVSDDTLIQIFKENNKLAKLQPVKWFLFSLALALSLISIHLLRNLCSTGSGYLPLGIILLFFSAASFIYYIILSRKT